MRGPGRQSGRSGRIGVRLAVGLLALVLLIVLAAWLALRASLPQLDGERHARGLSAPVTVARDADGVPVISGANRLDLAYATGFVHGQERYFQMDLLRRSAAGELAELFGAKALPLDRAHRLHRFRARAEAALQRLAPQERAFLDRYVAGVNDGLDALSARPFEYLLNRATPRRWTAADSLLVVWAMYFDLQGNQEARELARGWLQGHTDAAQLAFLLPEASAWDAPLDAPSIAAPAAPIPATAPSWWGRKEAVPARQVAGVGFVDAVGSNNYAVAGSRSATGVAVVSDDMHLGLQLPNTWYRLALRFTDAQGVPQRVVGVSLPGAPPLVIVGSNGHVAWAFTNSYADTLDLVRIEGAGDTAHPGQVRLPGGWETPVEHIETILVKGEPAQRLAVQETSLGPIREAGGVRYAVHWTAHAPGAVNLNHAQLESAGTLAQALEAAANDGIPAQNIVLGDTGGNIAWTIAGALPRRTQGGLAMSFPLAGAGAAQGWDGLLPAGEHPRIVNPAGGQLVTANSRQLGQIGAPAATLLGDGGFDLGARASQLRDRVAALPSKASVRDVFDACLDDRAPYVDGWRKRALSALDAQAVAGHPARASFRQLLETSWDGHASTGSVGYRLAQQYRWSLHDLLFGAANKAMATLDPKATMLVASSRWSTAVERLLDARPAAWLPPGYADWRALELAAIDRTIEEATADGTPLEQATWGRRNTVAIAHPITIALPALKRWLGAPPDQLPGDANMPRVAGPKFGQSERLTVSPGREEEGLFDMPGGQSGHPLSPFFLRGHDAWVAGKPQPLLPGAAKYKLVFAP
jgi:penicillin amidase